MAHRGIQARLPKGHIAYERRPRHGIETDGSAQNPELDSYYLYHAARADILRRMGRRQDAIQEYEWALALTNNAVEQRYLRRRLGELGRGE
jgi:RNA polymerase sigma-70 factor, ECF subfamily